MSAQAPKLLDLTLCDEVRREDNGKLLIIGMYLGAILVPRVPFRMPRLSFFLKWKTNGSLPTGDFRLTSPSKEAVGGFGMKTEREPESVAPVFYTTFALENIQLTETGTYSLSYKPPGGKRYRSVFTFEVGLREEAAQ
jgi:hypothetical protein